MGEILGGLGQAHALGLRCQHRGDDGPGECHAGRDQHRRTSAEGHHRDRQQEGTQRRTDPGDRRREARTDTADRGREDLAREDAGQGAAQAVHEGVDVEQDHDHDARCAGPEAEDGEHHEDRPRRRDGQGAATQLVHQHGAGDDGQLSLLHLYWHSAWQQCLSAE